MKMSKRLSLVAAALAVQLGAVGAEIDAVALQPPLATETLRCTEHYVGQLQGLGDELGTDCAIARVVEVHGRSRMRDYEGDGSRNDHWYSWMKPVLAPCDGSISKVYINSKVNEPGVIGSPPASYVVVDCTNDVHVILVHIQQPDVREGDRIVAGHTIATVESSGMSRSPHILVGAWRGKTPLQLRWDQREMGE